MEKLFETICTLPNDKTTGPSDISNEMIKHLGQEALKIIRLLFGIILHTSVYLSEWCYSKILPISKPKSWNLKLKNTRLIFLLDTIRKLMSILNCWLSKILKENSILKGPNYGSLSEESTFEPIQLLNVLTKTQETSKNSYGPSFRIQRRSSIPSA